MSREDRLGWRYRWSWNERFVIGQPGNPMLERWRLLQTPLFGIYVHFIYREDRDPIPHDHPWRFWSFVLRGGYIEDYRPDSRNASKVFEQREHKRWRLHAFPLAAAHIIAWVAPKTVTLVLVGRKVRTWGFYDYDDQGHTYFVDYRDALGLRPTEGIARKRPRDGEANDEPALVDHYDPRQQGRAEKGSA